LPDLADAVGSPNLLTDPDVVAGYCVDWTGRFHGGAAAVVRPASTDEVAAVVAACRRHGLALVPQGGNTGLVGGSVPGEGAVVLATTRLTAPADVDAAGGQATVRAGTTVAALHAAATAAGWDYGVDFAARDSATVGGTIATNAGGVRVLRHGDTRAQVLGVEAVLGDGSVVSHLGGLLKDNTGYHLPSLLCGSEGTLGVVTAARVRLVAAAPARAVALLGFAAMEDAVTAALALHRDLPVLDAAELMTGAGIDLVCRVLDLAPPFAARHAAVLLVEAAATGDPTAVLAEAVSGVEGVVDAAVATDGPRRAALWRYRESHTEAINHLGPPHKLDVTLPSAALAPFLAEVPAVVRRVVPGADVWLFGHAADGNIHVNVTGVAPDDEAADDAVLDLVAAHGGSISAEHGIGRAKVRWLHLNRSAAEIAAFRAIKRALDPDGILNPGVLLPEG
jgi:FAD/FMN-containing dehydrogenase